MRELLDFFNYIQFETVYQQQINLVKLTILHRSGDRRLSFNEFQKKVKSKINDEISNETLKAMQEYYTLCSIKEMLSMYKQMINDVLIEKYSLDKTSHEFITSVVMDLVFFYNNPKKEKTAKYFNSTLDTIFQNHKNSPAEKTINDNAEKDFINKFRDEFNVIHKSKKSKSWFKKQ